MKKTPGNDFEDSRRVRPPEIQQSSRNPRPRTVGGGKPLDIEGALPRTGTQHYPAEGDPGEGRQFRGKPGPIPSPPPPRGHSSGDEPDPERLRKVGTVKRVGEVQ